MADKKRITIEKNIKQDIASKQFYVTFYYGKDSSGKNKRKTKAYPTLNEARLELRKHEVSIMERSAIDPSRTSVNEVIERHLEMLSLKSEESTLYGYRTIARHIKGHRLGNRQAQEVKPVDVQAYLAHLQKDKALSSNTALKHYNFLNSVFNMMEQQELIGRNPVKRVVTPKKIAHDPEYLTVDEAREIFKRSKGDRIELPFALGLYTGMRRGELCGLTWDCVDFDNDLIRVRLNRLNVGSEIVLKQPKSESSERTLSMVPELKEILLTEFEILKNNKKLLGNQYRSSDFVICYNDGEPVRPNYLSEMFKRWFNRKLNKDLRAITPHGLRHSFVALAIAAGIPLYEISQALGHNDISVTSRIYAHLLDKTHKNVTEGMAGLLREDSR
ncbi:MAG: site-specific integrase [Oscillospiraceae bacterium]|nr:site-specific integrase [Oscillospiraceae bacterium]